MRVILVHGFNASPQMNFHPRLADQLRAKGFEVIAPTLPLQAGEEFDLHKAIEKMKEQVGYLKGDDILLGHSLGSLIILQYLEAIEMTETPRAVILVAPPWSVSRPELRQLFIADLDADVLMWKAREFIVIHSKDDKLVPIAHGRRLAEALRARFIETATDGHYMEADYSVLLETILSIAQTPHAFEPGKDLENDFVGLH
ncbi:hypothetical protein A2239_03130 [Candidatus Uhrbacteria bacterium RIFOXYA2_FULL_40_9]|nr:MAG: hypothetical protein UT94_C0049G0003 [Candidatus Uhrbacteria bacterium GW2011_GWF2_40_263]OGL93272.1 MAG: hypothetical protein A2239_03130 [Candidatus Uhrbacteria bacterium RIFOXYA2_FULL_40_9]OGL97177.1 MAG: hypothetical protein A2332_00650 [Candidatus Uhrbacteria bacterium RIFOXYB2_FULL_41_18]HBK35066.1 hypothetical protein [Candidatus Uhrbacteria bacterium]HCB55392.1 hypothetical protein [Candidatus Uhrbacteria bacterium]